MVKWGKVSKYRRRLFYNFFLLFLAFAIAITSYQFKREKQYRIGKLENKLQIYNNLINGYVIDNKLVEKEDFVAIDKLHQIFPEKDLRITIITPTGSVLYDSFVKDYHTMENHLHRPEVQGALNVGFGNSVRLSATTEVEYYYFALKYPNYYIRAALPYNIQIENFLKVDTIFIYVILLFFIIFGVLLIYFSDKFGKSIATLQDFATQAASGDAIDIKTNFPKNELGIIGEQIVEVYNRLQKTKKALSAEREKLIRHLQISHEGIAIFNKDKGQLLANTHFIQYLNTLSDETAVTPEGVFNIKELQPVYDFVDENIHKKRSNINELASDVLTLQKNGKYYVIQAIVFKDRTFEISINDVTKLEKDKKLKQEMTSNIAHELKTPVSSILGYLETIISSEMDDEKRRFFLERSYIQTQRLSSLIQDLSLLNKMEEAVDLFEIEQFHIKETVSLVIEDLKMKIEERNIGVSITIANDLMLSGNRSVFYSIWRNLVENTVNYAGDNVDIIIKNYHQDERFLYFSYCDTGTGIPEQHLSRIFERFYRVDSGRARSSGGTGLGLSIVKNGVLFHKGEIAVKKPKNGGVEFLFSISKEL